MNIYIFMFTYINFECFWNIYMCIFKVYYSVLSNQLGVLLKWRLYLHLKLAKFLSCLYAFSSLSRVGVLKISFSSALICLLVSSSFRQPCCLHLVGVTSLTLLGDTISQQISCASGSYSLSASSSQVFPEP